VEFGRFIIVLFSRFDDGNHLSSFPSLGENSSVQAGVKHSSEIFGEDLKDTFMYLISKLSTAI